MSKQATANKNDVSHMFSVGAGLGAGIFSTCVTNPLDTIRVRLAAGRAATGCNHRSLWLTIKDLFSNGAYHAFQRGLGTNILASAPSNAIYLSTYYYCHKQTKGLGWDERISPLPCACAAVTATNVVLAPLFLVRTRVQVDDKLKIRDVVKSVMQTQGFRGFYRGTITNIAGRFVEEGVFWLVYENLKRITKEGNFKESGFLWTSLAIVSLSGLSKMIGSIIAYPYNVIMTHQRTVNKITGKCDHVKIASTVRYIYRADGMAGFYKGLAPQIFRSVASKSSQLYAFETIMFLGAVFQMQGGRKAEPEPVQDQTLFSK